MKIALPWKSNLSGIPSLRSACYSDFQVIVRLLPESKVALSIFKHTSSNNTESQSSNTKMLPAAELLYSVWNKPIGVIEPLTISVLGAWLEGKVLLW